MFYDCGNGYGIYLTTEEFVSLSDEEFNYIISTQCYPYYDPFYGPNAKYNFNDYVNDDDDDTVKEPIKRIDDIINILDSEYVSEHSFFEELDSFIDND